MAWKSLGAHPVRTAVLGVGFGLGVSVMAILLGVGEVVLEQARAPELDGGGDLIVSGAVGRVTSARFTLENLARSTSGVVVASPRRRADLFLVTNGTTVPIRAYGGVPSLEHALGDPETNRVGAWKDAPSDAEWITPDPSRSLRAMDRFHAIPDVPARAGSWA